MAEWITLGDMHICPTCRPPGARLRAWRRYPADARRTIGEILVGEYGRVPAITGAPREVRA